MISVDAKKKEQVGEYAQAGREWRPKGDPVKVRDHSFADRESGHAIPYGVYDVGANTGFVNVGTGGNTAALAVESVRRWWNLAGKDAYPGAGRLLVCCDAGGSNGWRNRAWKAGLAALAAETGLEITVLPLPARHLQVEQDRAPAVLPDHPGLARPPADQLRRHHQHHQRGHHRNRAGRHRRPGHQPLPHRDPGQRRADERPRRPRFNPPRLPRRLELRLPARPPPAPPPPPPAPPPPGLCAPAALNHPALTGLDPAALDALTAALDLPFRARRELRRYTRTGRPRTRTGRAGGWNRKLGTAGHVIATRLRAHLNLPVKVVGALLGIDATTVSHATSRTASMLAGLPPGQHPPAAPPPAIRLRTLDDLRGYAAGHGIIIPAARPQPHTPPALSTVWSPDTPQTHLNLECLQNRTNVPSTQNPPRGHTAMVTARLPGTEINTAC